MAVSLSAQVRLDKPEMYLGADLGVTESMIMFNPAIPQGFLMGFNGGVVFRYIAEKNVGMQAELNFSQRGWTETTINTSSVNSFSNSPQTGIIAIPDNNSSRFVNINQKTSNITYSRQLNYIELPFMTHIYVGSKNRFFINIGPKISYMLLESIKTNDLNFTAPERANTVQHPFDYGLCAGFGYLVNIKGKIFQFDTRANYGLSDIFADQKKDYFATSSNFNISANLAWLFQVK